MKKLTYILLLISFISFSQEKQIFKIGLDPKLAISGAYSYDKTPVLDATLTVLTQLENGNEWGINIEYANLKPTYYHYGFIFNKVITKGNTIETLLGVELLALFRDFKAPKTQLWLTSGINAECRFYVFRNSGIALRYNYKYRPEYKIFRTNGMIELFTTF